MLIEKKDGKTQYRFLEVNKADIINSPGPYSLGAKL